MWTVVIFLCIVLFQQCNSASLLIAKPVQGSIDVSVPVIVNLELEDGGDVESSSLACYGVNSLPKKCTPLSAPKIESLEGLEDSKSYVLESYISNSRGVRVTEISSYQFTTADNKKEYFGLVQEQAQVLQQLGVDSYWRGDLTSATQYFKATSELIPDNSGPWEGVGASQFGLGHYKEAANAFLSAMSKSAMSKDTNSINMLRNARTAKNWEQLGNLVNVPEQKSENLSDGRTVSVVSTFFRGKGKYSETRFQEILSAQLANLHNPDIDTLVLVADVIGDCDPVDFLGSNHEKLKVVQQEGSGAPSWGELFRVGERLFNKDNDKPTVLFSHGDMAYFHQNASLHLLPSLLHADQPLDTPFPPAAGTGDSARPVAIALTRKPHSGCYWESGGGHLHQIPVDLCSGPHGLGEGVLGYDAFAVTLPIPPLLLSLADQLRTNHLGADLKMVEAMSLCDLLVVDPCLFVIGTHLHCTLERSYRHDEDWVTMTDVEDGRYSIAVRPNSATLLPHTTPPTLKEEGSGSPHAIVGFVGCGDDFLRSHLVGVGSVEHDMERLHMLDPYNCEHTLKAVVVPSMKLPLVGDSHFEGLLRRTTSSCCSHFISHAMSIPIGHQYSSIKVILIRDAYDNIAQNYLYQQTTHRSAHFMPRRDMPRCISCEHDENTLNNWVANQEYLFGEKKRHEWSQYAMQAARSWSMFYRPIAFGSKVKDSELLVVRYSELTTSPSVLAFLSQKLGLPDTVMTSQPPTPRTLGHIKGFGNNSMAFDSKLRNEISKIVSPVMCAFDMQLPMGDNSCDSQPSVELDADTPRDIPSLLHQFSMTDDYNKVIKDCVHIGESSHCVVAFSLYGDDERYTGGVLANAVDIHHSASSPGVLGPWWRMRVYHNHSSPLKVLHALEQLGVELVAVDTKEIGGQLSNPRAWRFLVAADSSAVNRFLLRDVDSRIGYRECAAVIAWMKSSFPFHVMRDHPSHTLHANQGFSMQAGMWGGTREAVPEMLSLMTSFSDSDSYHADQVFLRDKVWPLAHARGVLEHDSFGCDGQTIFPFPSGGRQYESDFIGAVVRGDGSTSPSDVFTLSQSSQPKHCIDLPVSFKAPPIKFTLI